MSKRIDQADWQIWVHRKNSDGSWHIILRWRQEWWINDDQGRKIRNSILSNSLVTFNLFPDGRIVRNNPSEGANPADVFPLLPADSPAVLKGWENVSPEDGLRSRFTSVLTEKTNGGLWAFDEEREDRLDPFFRQSWRCRFFFDSGLGLVKRAETEWDQQGGPRGKLTRITELKDIRERDLTWINRLADEVDCVIMADRESRNLAIRAAKERNAALLHEAESLIEQVRRKVTIGFLVGEVHDLLKRNHGYEQDIASDERRRAETIGKPAPEWEAKDLAGKTHRLADYRGKVVVLDFWYRRCAYCIKAMPQVIQISQDFKDKPVAVLGITIDEKEEDARFVVDKLKIPHAVIMAGDRFRKYPVLGFPTLIIIDQEGKIHSVCDGWSPKLREEVAEIVQALLARR